MGSGNAVPPGSSRGSLRRFVTWARRRGYAVKPLLSPKEVGQLIGVTRQRLYSWHHEGRGPPVVQLEGRLLRYRPEDLEAWIDSQREDGGPARTAAPINSRTKSRKPTNEPYN